MTVEFGTADPAGSAGSGSRRKRVAAGIGAAMLIAAAGGIGFGIGRSIDDDAVVTPSDDAPPAPVTEAPPAATDPVEPPAPVATEPPAASFDDVPESEAVVDAGSAVEPAHDVAAGGPGWTPFGNEATELLFERTTESGLIVRAHLGNVWHDGAPVDPNGGWQPPGWCFESGQVRLALAGDGVIDVSSVAWYAEPYLGRSVSWVTMGRPDGVPHRVIFVQSPPGTTLVTATFGDGAVDSVAPQGDVAVLVVAGAPETIEHDDGEYTWIEERPDFEVTFAGDGNSVVVEGTGVTTWDDPAFRASCSPPPPALPDPGEQPADAAASEAEIVDLMAAMYGEGGVLEFIDRIDDPTGVEAAVEQVADGGFQEEAASAQAIVEELVFTDPQTAWFRYRIETSGIDLDGRFGTAVLVDGTWKITRATICQDLSLAGGWCDDDVRTIRPPGAALGEDVIVLDPSEYED